MSDFHQVNVSTESAIKLRKDQKRCEAKLAALLAACEKIEQGNYHEQPPALGDIEALVNAFYDFRAERTEHYDLYARFEDKERPTNE